MYLMRLNIEAPSKCCICRLKYRINKARQECLPSSTPPEEVMQQLCEYTLGRIAYLFEVDSPCLMCSAEVNHQG